MDVHNMAILFRKEVDGNQYQFSMTQGAPYGQAYDAMVEAAQTLVKLAAEHAQKMARVQEQQADVKEEIQS